jgi:choloylglycine hydrolase
VLHAPFKRLARCALAVTACSAVIASAPLFACSDVMVPKDDLMHQVVSVRTLDFPIVDETIVTDVRLQAFEAGRVWVSDWQGIGNGRAWRNRYGFVGMHALAYLTKLLGGRIVNMDGLNTEGLSAAYLWLDAAKFAYPAKIPDRQDQSVAFYDVVNYFLGNFATVAEARRALTDPEFWGYIKPWGLPPFSLVPLHMVVRDATGASMIVEWTKGEQQIYDGPAVDAIGGLLTNDPPYPQQLANLDQQKYRDAKPEHGMAGIPGDSTMPGRFVRLAKLRQYALMNRGGRPVDALQVAAHLVNNVDVVLGTNHEDIPIEDFTGPVLIRDHVNRVLYFKGNNNQSYRKIVLANVDFGKPHNEGILADPMPGDPVYRSYAFAQDVTALLDAATRSELGPWGAVSFVRVTVNVPDADRTNWASSMFVWALTPDQHVLQWSGGAWTAALLTGSLQAAYVGPLAPLVLEIPVSALPPGTQIYSGFGATSLEMLLKQRTTLDYVVPDPLQAKMRRQ